MLEEFINLSLGFILKISIIRFEILKITSSFMKQIKKDHEGKKNHQKPLYGNDFCVNKVSQKL